MREVFKVKLFLTSVLFGTTTVLAFCGATTATPSLNAPPLHQATRIITVGPDNSTGKAGMMGGVMQP